jgi:membrane fusion protein, multidrug efflux system
MPDNRTPSTGASGQQEINAPERGPASPPSREGATKPGAPPTGAASSGTPPGQPSVARSNRLKTRRIRFLVLVIIVVLLVGGYGLWRYLSSYESTDDAEIDGHIDAVSARINGHLNEVLVEDAQVVHEGDPLVRIDRFDHHVQHSGHGHFIPRRR